MNLNELLQVLWRRKLIVVLVTAASIGIAIAALQLTTPMYESSTTLALTPRNAQNGLLLFGIMDTVVPVYADAAGSPTTKELARPKSPHPLSSVTVDTFKGTPIIKIRSRSSSPYIARDTSNAVTAAFLERVHKAGIGLSSVRVVELDRATLPTSPVFPRKGLTLLVAGLLGLILGVAAALLRESLATKVETPEELERLAGVPVFGEIPSEPGVTRVHEADDLLDTRLRAVSEAFRDLRTNLLFASGNVRSIVLTSPQGSHGKTTIAFGLAATLARTGTRTLLIDGDLRKGRMPEMLGIPSTPGLAEVLRGTPVEEAVQHTSLDTLDLLPGGTRGGDPVELLTSRFPALLSQLEELYETVVIDGTPLVPISDARVIARYADVTLLVASANRATRRHVRTAMERLSLISVRPTATVLNNYSARDTPGYYGPSEAEERQQQQRSGRGRQRARR
jgi:polysaccharide biosynthesis transport protein